MSIYEILYLSLVGLSVLFSIVMGVFGPKASKNKALNIVVEKNEKLLSLIKSAENFKNYTGKEKLNYVLSNFAIFCLNKGYQYDEAETAQEVEKYIELTNAVNVEKKNDTSKSLGEEY